MPNASAQWTILGAPFEFVFFTATLLCVAVFHRRTLTAALTGLAAITLYKLLFTGFDGVPGFAGLGLHGLRFMVTTTLERSRLLAILEKEDAFVTVFKPSVTEFDRMASSLSNELDALVEKIDKSLGRDSV